ncbi:MAG: (5-formylfuran-3-yl)methyl phosphate synthase, partial [Nitrososphaerales archaeon]
RQMKLLVSVTSLKEARNAAAGGANIVDVKNPSEGALGASTPNLLSKIRDALRDVELSATLGDLPNLPGTASFAAFGAAVAGADYVKVGLLGSKALNDAIRLSRKVVKACRGTGCKVVLAAYADYKRFRGLNPLLLPKVASASDADGVLVDVQRKDSGCVFDYLTEDELVKLSAEANELGLISALAGGLKAADVGYVQRLGFQIFGVRRAACRVMPNGSRLLDRSLVANLHRLIEDVKKTNTLT